MIVCKYCRGIHQELSKNYCPVLARLYAQLKFNKLAKKDYYGNSPNVIIGHKNYPNINVGILSTESYNNNDAPLLWSKENYQIPKIVELRSELINSMFVSNIKSFSNKLLSISQEISMSSKPVDVEINLNKKPQFKITFNQEILPHGPNVKLKQAKITENVKVNHYIDKVVSDTDLKAKDAVLYLYNKKFNEYDLTKLLSLGNLGLKKNRKLVPTRWGITAVDDILAKNLISNIKNYSFSDYSLYFGNYLGNHYLIMLFPNNWQYELFEGYIPNSLLNPTTQTYFISDYETYYGRKSYASNTAGGYYAARLSILEKLFSIKKQASALALRFITSDYSVPLGVWVCRQSVRNTLNNKPLSFNSLNDMLNYSINLAKENFNVSISSLLKNSVLLNNIKTQKRLFDFM